MLEYKNSDMLHVINEYIRNPRYRELLRLRFCEGRTYDEISEAVGYSPQHVREIVRKHKDLLIRHL